MGYSNVAGALNVFTSTSTDSLVVRGDTYLVGNLLASAGTHSFGNLTAANLTVTGNFTITATNTQVTNALSINNSGTATALKVVQFEGGGSGHTQNVAEFWDFTTLAMVIDPEGNVAIHTGASPGYALTVVQGASIDTVTSQLYMGNGSGISNVNSSNLTGALTSLQLSNTQSNITSLGTLVNLNVSGASWFTTANVTGGLGANTAFFNILKTNISNTAFLNASNAAVSNLLASNINVVTTANIASLTVTGISQASLLVGNASGLSNINSSNLVGNVAQANVALVVSQPAQPNVTSLGILNSLVVSGVLQADLLTGNASGLSNINGANVSTVPTAQSVIVAAQPNITSVGTLTSLIVSGVLNAGLFTGNASGLSNINSSNLVGNVAQANVALVVSQPTQPNVTSVGTLTGLVVSGILNSNLFTGNASGLSNINSSNLVGNVAQANVALVVSQPLQPNITRTGTLTALNVSGISNLTDIYANGFTSNSTNTVFNFDTLTVPFLSSTTLNVSSVSNIGIIFGQGNGISNILSSVLVGNVASANIALVVSQPAQPNITSVGTLTGLGVSGVLNAGLFTGNASGLSNINSSNLVGNVSQANVATVVSQPSQPNITSVGTLTSLVVSGVLNAGLFTGNASGLSNINSSNLVGNVAQANVAMVVSQPFQPNVIQVGTLTGLYSTGNITASFFTGQGNGLTNVISSVLVGNVAQANVALVVSQPAQPNITSVGVLSALTVSGVLQADLLTGNASGLSNINSSNLVGNVAQANIALVVSQPSQPNITSLGTLTSLSVSGVLNAGLFTGNASGISNINGSNVSTVPTAQSVIASSQPNVTSLGTLTGLTINGLLIASDASGLSNINSSNLVGNVARANVALVVSQPAQPNITSVGTLTGLTIAGILNSNLFTGNASGLSNINGANVSTVPTAQSVVQAAQTNITSVGTLTSLTVSGLTTSGFFRGSGNTLSNLNASNVTIGAFSASQLQSAQTNVTSLGTLTSLTVSGNSNLQTLNAASIATPGVIPVSSGLFMNLNATYTLNSTGNWTGNIAGSITSNLFTLFGPNPLASWTTYGSNPLITGPTANGGFRFNQTGPYQFTVVLTSDNNIKTIALSSNTSDVHSNLADPGVWLYCYRISVGQDPSVPVQIPFFVDSTSRYYFIDYESVRKTGENIHKTAYTNVVAEGYTGSYVTLRPL